MSEETCKECERKYSRCDWNKRGWGPCKDVAVGQVGDNGYCKKHITKMCCICGNKATHGCESGLGGLACGMALCDKPECRTQHVNSGHSGMSEAAKMITKSISGSDFFVET